MSQVRTVTAALVVAAVAAAGWALVAQADTVETLLFLALSGVATGLSWLCYFRALQLGEASRVAPIDKLSVVFAIILAGAFLHERLGWHHVAGGTLIVAGALVIAWK